MASLALTIRETLRYRGNIGQWAWVMHRLTGLGVVFFLIIHVVDTSWALFYPGLYEKAIAIYQSPLFTIGEFALVFAVVYHAFNGLRVAIFDFKPQWWQHQQKATIGVVIATIVVLVPVFAGMMGHVIDHYSEENVFILPLDFVLVEQLPFIVGMFVAAVVAVVISVFTGGMEANTAQASKIERFWWSFMRVSGILIVPLVFGHLAVMHVVQGVFDLTAAGAPIAGTVNIPGNPVVTGINESGTAVEFVMERWNYAAGGVFIWKVYDMALLALVTIHGFNGLRYVLTDYTADNPMLRRASNYVCIIGALVLMAVGGGALLGTITPDAIGMAQESMCKINPNAYDGACAEILGSAGIDLSLGD